MIITIDGSAGTGKSTIAKKLAKKLGFIYFDTGAMYRAIAYLAIKRNVNLDDKKDIDDLIKNFSYAIETDASGEKRYFVNGEEVTEEIRSIVVTEKVSAVSSVCRIRKAMIPFQKKYAKKRDVVFEGRDMGSVVFPHAEVKFFLIAKPEVCAERRFKEIKEKFPDTNTTYEDIFEEIKKRDEKDTNRKISPLICPKDSFTIDTSSLSISEVVDKSLSMVQEKQEMVFSRKKKFFYRFILTMLWCFFKLFYRFKVYGVENFIKGKAIIAANHTSYYDPPAVAIASPEEIYFLAKKSLFKIPFFHRIIESLNSLPISREVSDRSTFRKIETVLNRGKKILFFPEGSRSFSHKIQPFLHGVGFIVYLNKCSVIPVYIHGAQKVWGRKRKFPKLFGKIICIFGRPIEPKFFEKLDKKQAIEAVTNKIQQSLLELQQWHEEGCKGPLP